MSVTAAAGFRAAGMAAGIKPDGRLDLSLVLSDNGPVSAAAVFTRSATEAAPVTLSRRHVSDGRAAAVVLNSGCANAGTGATGERAAAAMAHAIAGATGQVTTDILVCSTGPIGSHLPDNLPDLAVSLVAASTTNGLAAAQGIMTTDSVPKQAIAVGSGWIVGGMAKGAGMVRPDMATMLAVLTTDADVDPKTLSTALSEVVDSTFNSLNIDGCQSTNDTVIVMASGASGISPTKAEFVEVLSAACRQLALSMAEDAEGASRVVTLNVSGADSDAAARRLGMAVADSALVRASFYGGDPNWGRIYGALGAVGLPVQPRSISIAYQGVTVAHGGVAVPFDTHNLAAEMKTGPLQVDISVGAGAGTAIIITTDLTPEYVVFNGTPS